MPQLNIIVKTADFVLNFGFKQGVDFLATGNAYMRLWQQSKV